MPRRTQDGICGLAILKSMRLTAKQLEQARRKIIPVKKKKKNKKCELTAFQIFPLPANLWVFVWVKVL
jgi:ribosomal protein L16/L10AE